MALLTNALNANYVQMHGMKTSKWTTKDKITQYKGLVNLYKRDRAITQIDASVFAKRQYKELVNLRKTIDADRKELKDAAGGDRQQLRNQLADHRSLQLAYQYAPPKKVIEEIYQVNFNTRKVLDRMFYEMKQKCLQLKDLKLEEALLQDRLKYEHYTKYANEKEAQNITGKVQNALLKKEAALAIQQSYAQIIDVMKKDALYFHGILTTIESDYWYQCRCVLNATKQGQLATEYKNDREQEFCHLEKAVISDMKTQKEDLKRVRQETENVQSSLKQLLRRDSDLTTCVIEVEDSEDYLMLHADLEKIESALSFLQNKTLVTSFEGIYPSMVEQVRQKKRLRKFVKKCERNKDLLLNKLNHAELMSNVLDNTMVENTGEYVRRKKELLEMISAEVEKKHELDLARSYKQGIIAQVGIALRQLQQLCKTIRCPGVSDERSHEQPPPPPYASEGLEAPAEEENDGLSIIASLTPKLTYLTASTRWALDPIQLDTAFKYYETLMNENCIAKEVDLRAEDSLLEGLGTEVSHLLTREDIKKQSADLVAASTKDEDLVPVFPIKKKKKKF